MMKNLIEQCENARGTDNKVIVATTLFRFATDNAMDFIRSHLRLNNVMIFKAASLMVEGHRYPNMMVVLERFLEVSQINPADIRSFVRKIETRHAE